RRAATVPFPPDRRIVSIKLAGAKSRRGRKKMSNRRELARLRAAAKAGDMAGAEYWSRIAAPSGDITAKMVLGILLCDKGNDEEGISWLKAAASSKDPKFTTVAGMAAAVLGRSLLERIHAGHIPREQKNLDEVEHWMKIAIAAGYEVAQGDLEVLERTRRGETQGRASQGSGGDVLQTFDVSFVTFYDGSGHCLGPSMFTLT